MIASFAVSQSPRTSIRSGITTTRGLNVLSDCVNRQRRGQEESDHFLMPWEIKRSDFRATLTSSQFDIERVLLGVAVNRHAEDVAG